MFNLMILPPNYLLELDEALNEYNRIIIDQHYKTLKQISHKLNICQNYIDKNEIEINTYHPLNNYNISFIVINDKLDQTLFRYTEEEIDGIKQEIITINQHNLTPRLNNIQNYIELMNQPKPKKKKRSYQRNNKPINDNRFNEALQTIKKIMIYTHALE